MYIGQAFSDAITDLIILTMPIPRVSCPQPPLQIWLIATQIWALQLPAKQKVGVIGMFLLGVL